MPKPLQILTVLNYYHPYISGVTEYARLIAEALTARGHSVTVLTGRHRKDLPAEETRNGVRVVRAEPFLFLHKGYLSADYVWKFRQLSRQADAIHMHLPMLESGLLVLLAPARKPPVVTYHCDVTPSRNGSMVDKLAVWAVRTSCRLSMQRAGSVAVSSLDYASGSSVVAGLEKKVVEIFPPDKAPEGALARRDGENDAVRIGFLGRFVEEKGIDVLLEAAPLVLQRIPRAKFILAGDYSAIAGGSIMESLRQRLEALQDRVELLGKVPEEQLFDFYRSLDLFLLPSINSYEAFGMVQVEAMKSGVPVVASDLRGVRTPIQKTGQGILVPPRDAQALAKAVVAYLSRPQRPSPEEVASSAWKVFHNENSVDGYERLLRQAAGEA